MKAINRLSALIGVICGLILSPLTLAAQNLVVSNSAHPAEADKSYLNNATQQALLVTGSDGWYSGTNINLTASSTVGAAGQSLQVNTRATAAIVGGTFTSNSGGESGAIQVLSSSTLSLREVTVNSQRGFGLIVNNATATLMNSNFNAASVVVVVRPGANVLVESSTFNVLGDGATSYAINAEYDNVRLVGNHVTINTSGTRTMAVVIKGTSAYIELNDSEINASGLVNNSAVLIWGTAGEFVANRTTINSAGGGVNAGVGNVTLNNSAINAGTLGVSMGGTARASLNQVTISASGTGLRANGGGVVNGTDVAITAPEAIYVSGTGSVTLDNADKAITGNILNADEGSVVLNLNAASTLTGDVTVSGTSVTAVSLNNSVFTGASAVNDDAALTVVLDNNSNWNLTGKSNLTTLNSANGSIITIANVQGEDLTVSDGVSGQTKLNLTLANSVKGQQEIHVVVDESNAMGGDAFSLDNTVSAGMQTYGLDNRSDGAWLVLGGGAGGGFTGGGDAVLNSAAGVSSFWFTQQDNLLKRMGELRYNAPRSSSAHPELVEGLVDNIWIRSYGQQVNLNSGISGVKGFSETQYGVDLGADKAWELDKANTLYTGVFAGYGGADRDFHSGYNGSTDSGYGGLYGTWINQDGWYADAVAKGQYFDTSFDGEDHGSYNSYGVGLSLELGRQFQFADGWFAEPSVQVSYLHLINDNYNTTQGMSVELDDADIIQFYGGARFGRNIKLNQSGWLQPYVKVGAIEQISSGGQVRASGGEWRPTTDGARGVIGAGIVYQLDDWNQLHLDYEVAFGDKYDKPWGLNFGYRHQF